MHRYTIFIAILISLFSFFTKCSKATSPSHPECSWEKVYEYYTRCTDISLTKDGGYITTGQKKISNEYYIYILKIDGYGNKSWSKTYGPGEGRAVLELTDGGFIIGANYDNNIKIIKTDNKGSEEWSREFNNYNCNSMIHSKDGGYIIAGVEIAGVAEFNVCLIKISSSGEKLWLKTFGGEDRDKGNCVVQTENHGYLIGGSTFSYGTDYSADFYLIKTNSAGESLWTKSYGGSSDDGCYSVEITHNNFFLVCGYAFSFEEHGYVLKINNQGDSVWLSKLNWDYCRSIKENDDGNYIIAGEYNNDIKILELDSDGNENWCATHGSEFSDKCMDMEIVNGKSYIVLSESDPDGTGGFATLIIKTASRGEVINNK